MKQEKTEGIPVLCAIVSSLQALPGHAIWEGEGKERKERIFSVERISMAAASVPPRFVHTSVHVAYRLGCAVHTHALDGQPGGKEYKPHTWSHAGPHLISTNPYRLGCAVHAHVLDRQPGDE